MNRTVSLAVVRKKGYNQILGTLRHSNRYVELMIRFGLVDRTHQFHQKCPGARH